MWASYSLLSIIGVFHPLKMIPIALFEILYKIVWLIIVACPLWSANQLAGSPAEEMTRAFLWVPLIIVATPWKYVLHKYVLNRKTQSARRPASLMTGKVSPDAKTAESDSLNVAGSTQ
jgi:hypothetical protein